MGQKQELRYSDKLRGMSRQQLKDETETVIEYALLYGKYSPEAHEKDSYCYNEWVVREGDGTTYSEVKKSVSERLGVG